MATDTYWQLEKEYYPIAEKYDLIIRVIEHEIIKRAGEGDDDDVVFESVPKKVHEFKVVREALANSDIIDAFEDSAKSMQIWFMILHDNDKDFASTYSTTTVLDIWEMLEVAYKYGFDPKCKGTAAWFTGWYDAHKAFSHTEYQGLAFPSYTFDDPEKFAAVTKYLVYNTTGHVQERRPDGFKHDHLKLENNTIIQQLNAAKGRLKTILHRNLYKPIDKLLEFATCAGKEKTLFWYEKSLKNTGAWPLESAYLHLSMASILDKFDKFSAPRLSQACSCRFCRLDFASHVKDAVEEIRKYFNGLCLDCMNASKPKFDDTDEDYWHHADKDVQWDHDCRISHEQPTWYFSFMGRKQKQIQWTKRSRDRI